MGSRNITNIQKQISRTPKPSAAGSTPVSPASNPKPSEVWDFFIETAFVDILLTLETKTIPLYKYIGTGPLSHLGIKVCKNSQFWAPSL